MTTRYVYWEGLSPPIVRFSKDSVAEASCSAYLFRPLFAFNKRNTTNFGRVFSLSLFSSEWPNIVFLLFKIAKTWWTFRICFSFFLLREGKGESKASGRGGGSIFIEKSRKGAGVLQEGEGLRGREGVCGELGNLGGGGANIFFSGPKCPPRKGRLQTRPPPSLCVVSFVAILHNWVCNNWVGSTIGCTPRGSCNRTLLRRVLRRFFKGSAS